MNRADHPRTGTFRPLRATVRRWPAGRLLLVLLPGLLLLGPGCERASVREGRALFAAHCARCHGAQAVGQDPRRPLGGIDRERGLLAPALNGTGHCWEHTTEELVELIAKGTGLPNSPMPAWGGRLREPQIRALVDYIRALWPRHLRRRQAS